MMGRDTYILKFVIHSKVLNHNLFWGYKYLIIAKYF